MAREDIEIVRAVYDAVGRRDWECALGLYDDDVDWDFSSHPAGDIISRKQVRGHDGLRDWFREWRNGWLRVEDSLEELIPAGDHVIAVVTSHGVGRGSGLEVTLRHAGVFSVRGGKVVRVRWFGSREDALAATSA